MPISESHDSLTIYNLPHNFVRHLEIFTPCVSTEGGEISVQWLWEAGPKADRGKAFSLEGRAAVLLIKNSGI